MSGLVPVLPTGLSVIQQARKNYLSFRDVSKAQIIIQDLTASNRINQTLAPCMLVNKAQSPFHTVRLTHKSLKKMTMFQEETVLKSNRKLDDPKS